jgi:hypothetical protein
MGRDLRSGGVNRFRVHASARLSITVRRWDDSTQSIGAGFRWFLFRCMRIYDPMGELGRSFESLGLIFPSGTVLFIQHASLKRAVSIYRIQNHNLSTLNFSVRP